MDKFKLLETFSNEELFVKTAQDRHVDTTTFRFECKRLDRKGRRKTFLFSARNKKMEVFYVNFFLDDIQESFLAARIYNFKFLWDAINS